MSTYKTVNKNVWWIGLYLALLWLVLLLHYVRPLCLRHMPTVCCGMGHNKPRPLLSPSECNWLWAMAGDNKLTFDPPTRLPELTQNLIRSSHGHSTPSLKISCRSVQPFSRNVADMCTMQLKILTPTVITRSTICLILVTVHTYTHTPSGFVWMVSLPGVYRLGRYPKVNFRELLWRDFLQAGCPSCHPTALKHRRTDLILVIAAAATTTIHWPCDNIREMFVA